MNVGIYFNQKYLDENSENIEKISAAFSCNGNSCKVIEACAAIKGLDVLFVLGGDGTILAVAAACAKYGVKIIGINYGHIGFLAEFEPSKLDEAIELVKSGGYQLQRRSMLEIRLGQTSATALNDVVFSRFASGIRFNNTVEIFAFIDGEKVDEYSADGLIISTPTGSTAYSLSAGGSVLTPDIQAFVLTPVCAHSLHARPVVFSDKSTVKVSSENPLVVAVDGSIIAETCAGEEVEIKKSDLYVEFITREGFFNKLLKKLTKWSE